MRSVSLPGIAPFAAGYLRAWQSQHRGILRTTGRS
jgi:hypothetical protein